ncbi:MAG TPA: hypothetical protein VHK47_20680 [Polyangia bacterium]|jgi:hypothetical protein|nr:hypothetical protein [Polyangia bacterium]
MTREGRWRALGLLAVAFVAACATTEQAAIVPLPPPAAAAPATVRLAVMPLEVRTSGELAAVINPRLKGVTVDGVTDTFQAPVSMEMAQLAIECIDHTPACYAAVGRSVGADRLLWAELERGGRGGAVKLRIALFDVARGEMLRQGGRAYPSVKAARAGGAALVDEVFGLRTAQADPAP